MRYVELKVRAEDRWFHDIDRRIAATPGLRHGPIHHVKLLDDGTAVTLYEIHGDAERFEALFDDHDQSLYGETVAVGDVTFVYSHFEPSPVVRALLEMANEHRILVDTPLCFTEDDELQITVVGDADTIQAVYTSVPETAQVVVGSTGEYRPSNDRLFAELTERQQEVLAAAIEMGYYEDPRRTTYGEIAQRVGCTETTVGEHLRKVENQVLRAVTPNGISDSGRLNEPNPADQNAPDE